MWSAYRPGANDMEGVLSSCGIGRADGAGSQLSQVKRVEGRHTLVPARTFRREAKVWRRAEDEE